MTESTNSASEAAGNRPVGNILLVDDEVQMRVIMEEYLRDEGYVVSLHADGQSALEFARSKPGWTEVLLTDLRLPGGDGLALLQEMQRQDETVVGILMTGYANTDNAVEAIRAGAFDFIGKPFDFGALDTALNRALRHSRVLRENRQYHQRMAQLLEERGRALSETTRNLEASYQYMLESMVALLEAREQATGEHTLRVTAMAVALAGRMGLGEEEQDIVRRGSFLHDIGKIAIPDHILLKDGPLDDDEWAIMKTHVEIGYRIINSNPFLWDVAELVYSHHERWDGSGYPRGLAGDKIPAGARIFAVVDAYDAMRSNRPYSPARSVEECLTEIRRHSGRQFDPDVVAVLLENHHELETVWRQGAEVGNRRLRLVHQQEGEPRA